MPQTGKNEQFFNHCIGQHCQPASDAVLSITVSLPIRSHELAQPKLLSIVMASGNY